MKKVGICQSNYIPWKGYFDLINSCDEFILYDDMQYTKNDWRNRNKIKTVNGVQWITIPIQVKGQSFQKIRDKTILDPKWNIKHWRSLSFSYAKSKYFASYKDIFEDLYLNCHERYLSSINHRFISQICRFLDIKTKISWSSDYHLIEGKSERLVDLCLQAGGGAYISGPSAMNYLDIDLFRKSSITVEFMDYSAYPEYNQLFQPFVHEVTILDLIFNEGPNAQQFMKSF